MEGQIPNGLRRENILGKVPLASAYSYKVVHNGTSGVKEALRRRYDADLTITIAPLIIGARGIWCTLNRTVANLLGLKKIGKSTIIADVLKGG